MAEEGAAPPTNVVRPFARSPGGVLGEAKASRYMLLIVSHWGSILLLGMVLLSHPLRDYCTIAIERPMAYNLSQVEDNGCYTE